MSGYLANLLTRTFEQPPAIRPRLASIFAPEPGPGWLSSPLQSEEQATAAAHPDQGSPVAAPPSEARAAPIALPTVATDDSAKGPVEQLGRMASLTSPSGQVRVSANQERAGGASGTEPFAAPRQPASDAPVEPQEVTERRSSRRPSPTGRTPVLAGRAEQPAESEPLSQVASATPETDREVKYAAVSARNRHALTSAPESSSASSIIRGDLERLYLEFSHRDTGAGRGPRPTSTVAYTAAREASASWAATDDRPLFLTTSPRHVAGRDNVRASRDRVAQSQPAAQSPPPAPPTIEVTIGKIEVRAATTAESRRNAPASTTAPNLDEYLRRRSGGGSP